MPIIGLGVRVPGTDIGVAVQYAHQTRREKEHDTAISILEQDAREHTGEKSVDGIRSELDQLLSSPGLLDRLGYQDDLPPQERGQPGDDTA